MLQFISRMSDCESNWPGRTNWRHRCSRRFMQGQPRAEAPCNICLWFPERDWLGLKTHSILFFFFLSEAHCPSRNLLLYRIERTIIHINRVSGGARSFHRLFYSSCTMLLCNTERVPNGTDRGPVRKRTGDGPGRQVTPRSFKLSGLITKPQYWIFLVTGHQTRRLHSYLIWKLLV